LSLVIVIVIDLGNFSMGVTPNRPFFSLFGQEFSEI